ncbi:MAG: hypothetical protein KBC50_03470 [Candidatus Pacebacteria bacterium]|nr:hypothetical protein [Candidatus Paceibacterota bacterium]
MKKLYLSLIFFLMLFTVVFVIKTYFKNSAIERGFSSYYSNLIWGVFSEVGNSSGTEASIELVEKLDKITKDENLNEYDRQVLNLLYVSRKITTEPDWSSPKRKLLQDEAFQVYKNVIDSVDVELSSTNKRLFGAAVANLIGAYQGACFDPDLLKNNVPEKYKVKYNEYLTKNYTNQQANQAIILDLLTDAKRFLPTDKAIVSRQQIQISQYLLNYGGTLSEEERQKLVDILELNISISGTLEDITTSKATTQTFFLASNALAFDVANRAFSAGSTTLNNLINSNYDTALLAINPNQDPGLGSVFEKWTRVNYATSLYNRNQRDSNKIDELLSPIYSERGSNESNMALSYCLGKTSEDAWDYTRMSVSKIGEKNSKLADYLNRIAK